jgi:acyl-CoA thioester hydrolase
LRLKDERARQLAPTYPLHYRQRVLFSDVDALRHLNNGAITRYFEEGRAQAHQMIFHASNELTPRAPMVIALVLVRLVVEFLREGRYPGEVEIRSGISSIGTSSIVHAHGAFQDGACLAVAEAVMVKSVDGRPVPLSDQERSASEHLMIRHTRTGEVDLRLGEPGQT